jgi:hypothetical protein
MAFHSAHQEVLQDPGRDERGEWAVLLIRIVRRETRFLFGAGVMSDIVIGAEQQIHHVEETEYSPVDGLSPN